MHGAEERLDERLDRPSSPADSMMHWLAMELRETVRAGQQVVPDIQRSQPDRGTLREVLVRGGL